MNIEVLKSSLQRVWDKNLQEKVQVLLEETYVISKELADNSDSEEILVFGVLLNFIIEEVEESQRLAYKQLSEDCLLNAKKELGI